MGRRGIRRGSNRKRRRKLSDTSEGLWGSQLNPQRSNLITPNPVCHHWEAESVMHALCRNPSTKLTAIEILQHKTIRASLFNLGAMPKEWLCWHRGRTSSWDGKTLCPSSSKPSHDWLPVFSTSEAESKNTGCRVEVKEHVQKKKNLGHSIPAVPGLTGGPGGARKRRAQRRRGRGSVGKEDKQLVVNHAYVCTHSRPAGQHSQQRGSSVHKCGRFSSLFWCGR